MQLLKIQFVDFWVGFLPNDNYFFNLLSSSYQVELSGNPSILIYSCFGSEHLKYKCTKVFYTGENIRPDFSICNFAISFDYNNDPRHYHLPLYALFIDRPDYIKKMVSTKSREDALNIWNQKSKFCCMVVSNAQSKKRLDFFEKLSKYKKVDSGGEVMNNIGGPVSDKKEFIKDYRFVIAFENAVYPGYTTEKIVEPYLMDCIPIYWGDPMIKKDFNTNCFLNLANLKSEDKLIEEIIAIDTNEEKAVNMLIESKFSNGRTPEHMDKERLICFFEKVIYVSININHPTKKARIFDRLYKIRGSLNFNSFMSNPVNLVKKISKFKILKAKNKISLW